MQPTIEQLKLLIHDIEQLNDPEVRMAARGVFGSPSDPGAPLPEPTGIEVDIVYVVNELVYRVVLWLPPEVPSRPGVKMGSACRWAYATPPWDCKASLRSLPEAVAFLRTVEDGQPVMPGAGQR